MDVKEMREYTFPTSTLEEWQEKSEESLKGRKIETLEKQTYENIKLKPLYTRAEGTQQSQYPAQSDFRRGFQPLGYFKEEWRVAQKLSTENGTLKETLSKAFDSGQTAIALDVTTAVLSQLKEMEEFHGQYPYSVNAREHHEEMIKAVSGFSNAGSGTGFIAKDPIALLAEQGASENILNEKYDSFHNTVKKARVSLPYVRTILVDTIPYHNGGANAVQELAIALSTAVTHIEELSRRDLSIEEIISKLVFQFAVGTNFFIELSKLRASRILWNKIMEAYGIAEEKREMVIAASTSSYTKTVYDPYVNMLRAGSEAFAAVLGGVQYLHVSPYNEPEGITTDFSDRIARNIQLILKEEAHLTKTVDPAGGSWYIEHLTTELAEKAWELFLSIDERGGMIEVLKQGWLQSEIAAVRAKREEAISTRKQTIVGTNRYADLRGDQLEVPEKVDLFTGGFIEPIPQRRLAVVFEQLRKKADSLTKPFVGLITLGELRTHKARLDFVNGFLAPGGIEGVASGEVNRAEEALAFMKESNYRHYCLCGSNEQYEEFGLEIAKQIKAEYPDIQLYLAGLPTNEEKWLQIGIRDFIHLKSNCYETLAALIAEMEVASDE